MKIICSEENLSHDPKYEIRRGRKVKAYERAIRTRSILSEFRRRKFGQIMRPDDEEIPLLEVHDPDYLTFLKEIHSKWVQEKNKYELIPYCWPTPSTSNTRPKSSIGQLGFFAGDSDTPIVAGTWSAAYSAASCAATAARQITRHGERFAFALTRPPGHHAGRKTYSGYCFLNNAAIACSQLKIGGLKKIALLDIDYHHGNGSQSIFETRSDVLYISIHADPDYEYPFFSGRSHEVGIGRGKGFTKNYPLKPGSKWKDYEKALKIVISEIEKYEPDALVVSLGVDTSNDDPLGTFKLFPDAYHKIGALLAGLNLRTLFILEGGYAYSSLGSNVYSLLSSFEAQTSCGEEKGDANRDTWVLPGKTI